MVLSFSHTHMWLTHTCGHMGHNPHVWPHVSKNFTHEDTQEKQSSPVGTCVASCVIAQHLWPHMCLILRCGLICVLTCGPPRGPHGDLGSTSYFSLREICAFHQIKCINMIKHDILTHLIIPFCRVNQAPET